MPGTSDPTDRLATPTRRRFFRFSAIGLVSLGFGSLTSCNVSEAPEGTPAPIATKQTKVKGTRSCLDRTIILGKPLNPDLHYRRLTYGPAEIMIVRQDFAVAGKNRATTRKGIVTFGHLTDLHIIDAASPGRMTFLYQYSDFENGLPATGRFRPQDMLTVQVLDAMVRRINAAGHGTLTDRPLDLLISTGDITDTRGSNELTAAINVLNGNSATVNVISSGYEGLQDNSPAPHRLYDAIWHPGEVDNQQGSDQWKSQYGYPTVPNFLEVATHPIQPEGTSVPWYIGFGNHDELENGTARTDTSKAKFIRHLAQGNRLPLARPKGMDSEKFAATIRDADTEGLDKLLDDMPYRVVTASQSRASISKKKFIEAMLNNPGTHGPSGHGFTADNLKNGTGYYRFDMASGVVGLMLDTTDPSGASSTHIDDNQLAWLEAQLRSLNAVYYDDEGLKNTNSVRNKLTIIFSHHPSASFPGNEQENQKSSTGVSRSEILAILGRFPNTILWVNGHQHRNRIWKHKSENNPEAGFWEINTSSHIDYPQQSRIIEVADNYDGTISIASTMFDHSDIECITHEGKQSSASLAALSLELAMNRPGIDMRNQAGNDQDRNVELILNKPF